MKAFNDKEEAGIKGLLADRFVGPLDSRIARYAGYLARKEGSCSAVRFVSWGCDGFCFSSFRNG